MIFPYDATQLQTRCGHGQDKITQPLPQAFLFGLILVPMIARITTSFEILRLHVGTNFPLQWLLEDATRRLVVPCAVTHIELS